MDVAPAVPKSDHANPIQLVVYFFPATGLGKNSTHNSFS